MLRRCAPFPSRLQPGGEWSAFYGAVRDWIERELPVEMKSDAVRKLVRYRMGAKLKSKGSGSGCLKK